jgi:antitoxin ParD1/3/4
MTTMNVSLPDELKTFVDTQVNSGGYGSTSEYIRDLIRRAQDRDRLRSALLEGAASPVAATADDYLDTLRARIPKT